jgi:sulfate adenylyltransferase (ADP) / ATP adenylyltransferase
VEDLWTLAARCSAHALATGALEPWSTREVTVEDEGIAFSVRLVSSLERRREATRRSGNPFLDPDPDLLVVPEWPPDHRLLLNKFPALDHHLLLTTRAFVPQTGLLDLGDFQALCAVLAATDGLGFYNAGPIAGASQPHRHLQVVRAPIGAVGRFPTEHLLLAGTAPFRFARAVMPTTAVEAHDAYVRLLGELGHPAAWNLLATRELLVVVPRVREGVGDVSVNALGFAGSLFAGNEAELDAIRRLGPCALIRAVSGGQA